MPECLPGRRSEQPAAASRCASNPPCRSPAPACCCWANKLDSVATPARLSVRLPFLPSQPPFRCEPHSRPYPHAPAPPQSGSKTLKTTSSPRDACSGGSAHPSARADAGAACHAAAGKGAACRPRAVAGGAGETPAGKTNAHLCHVSPCPHHLMRRGRVHSCKTPKLLTMGVCAQQPCG